MYRYIIEYYYYHTDTIVVFLSIQHQSSTAAGSINENDCTVMPTFAGFGLSHLIAPFELPWANHRPIPGQQLVIPGQPAMFIRDPSINHPLQWETVSSNALGALVCSGLFLLVWIEHLSPRPRRLATAAYAWLKATAATEILVVSLKSYCGVLRPNFYALCSWDDEAMRCMTDDTPGRTSFPSGHSGHSACFATLLTLHIIRCLEAQLASGERPLTTMVNVILRMAVYIPPMIAILVASSRVHDNVQYAERVNLPSFQGESATLSQFVCSVCRVCAQPPVRCDCRCNAWHSDWRANASYVVPHTHRVHRDIP